MSGTLFRSAVWYWNNWRVFTIPQTITQKPLIPWSDYYAQEVGVKELMDAWRNVRAAGLAALYVRGSSAVVLDIDAYRVGIRREDVIRWGKKLSENFVVALTRSDGLRVMFSVTDTVPGCLEGLFYEEPVGEGGGECKHLWTLPPSVTLTKDGKERRQYVFITRNGFVRYPWELGRKELPEMTLKDGLEMLELITGVKYAEKTVRVSGLKLKGGGRALPTIPCWNDLEEFSEWLELVGEPPLPRCVAMAIGYDTTEVGMIHTGKTVPEGLRFTLGSAAVMFLSACIANADPKEIIEFVGENLENFPNDKGEPLDRKFSRLLTASGNRVIPAYAGLGSLANALPERICNGCPYASECRGGYITNGGIAGGTRFIPWHVYVVRYYRSRVLRR